MTLDLFDAPSRLCFPPPRAFQETTHRELRSGFQAGHQRQIVCAPTGAGKCLALGEKVLLFNGITARVEDIRPGDLLMGPDSKPRRVLSVTRGEDELFRITPARGDSWVCNSVHVLTLKHTETGEIVDIALDEYLKKSKWWRHCHKQFSVGVDFPQNLLTREIDPYFLGLWLGDGTKALDAHGRLLRVAISKPDAEVRAECERMAGAWGLQVWVDPGGCPTYRIVGERGDGNPLLDSMRQLLGPEAHVPHQYKTASRQERLALLAGLLDSDGHLSHGGFDFVQKSDAIIDGAIFVARSLGLKVTNSVGKVVNGEHYRRIHISGDLSGIPLRIPRKRAGVRAQKKDALRTGFSVESLGRGEYAGFELDGDGRFLLGDFTVTHNTYLALRVCSEALARGKRVLFVCDRTTLIKQTSEAADKYGMPTHGIIQADNPRFALFRPFQIASAQTIEARGITDNYDVIVIDEAHTVYSATTKLIQETKAAVIGLSATPFTAGLGKTYTRVINAATMDELVRLGVLTPLRVLSCTKADMRGAKTKAGEWTAGDAGKRGLAIVGDVVREWLEHANNAKSIVFGPSVVHAEALVSQFKAAGVRAELFTGKTSDDERKALLEEYRKPDSSIRLLISVEALAKGFDVPDVSCVVDCRPLRKSLSTFVQMVGRGLRSSEGKTECLLLDHSGNVVRFADDFAKLYFDGLAGLDQGEKLDKEVRKDEERPPKKCPSCGYTPCGKRCIRCGFEAKAVSLITHEEGRAKELDVLKRKEAQREAQLRSYAPDLATLYAAIVTAERERGQRRVDAGRPAGKVKEAAAVKYKQIVGNWPGFDFRAAPYVRPNEALRRKLSSMDIAYARSLRERPARSTRSTTPEEIAAWRAAQ